MSVFQEQTLLVLILNTTLAVDSATVLRILYTKPSGASGYWTASEYGGASPVAIQYQIIDGDIDESGLWKFQSYVEIGGKKAPGDVVTKNFEKTLVSI